MTTARLGLQCIDQLIDHAFFIPSYQRGYRWSSIEVTALLNDLHQFRQRHSRAKGEEREQLGQFYCLQPIVVLRDRNQAVDESGRPIWRLVDGQQRLTTIHLVMRYLEKEGVHLRGHFGLSYETRNPRYLLTLDAADRWDTPDAFYMHQAYQAIDTWFRGQHPNTRHKLASILLDPMEEERNTRVIWYDLGASARNQHEIDAFIRLNAGKIRLTNAELIRALFLKADNFSRTLRDLSQIKLAQEWDRIEKRLQDDRFWYFLHGGPSPYTTRIDHLFRIHLLAHHEGILEDVPENAAFRTFLGYQELEKRAEQETSGRPQDGEARVSLQWSEIKQLAMRLEEWHQDPVLYHLVGFWIAYKGDLGEDNVRVCVDLLARRDSQRQGHRDFEEGIKADIFQALFKGQAKLEPLHTLDHEQLVERVAERLGQLEYSGNSKRNSEVIRPILLLFNIATVLQDRTANTRFPFDLYREQKWDLEHIRSVDSRRPKRPEDQRRWLATVIEYWTGRPATSFLPRTESELSSLERALASLLQKADGELAEALSQLLGVDEGLSLDLSAPRADAVKQTAPKTAVVRFLAEALRLLATERFDQGARDQFDRLYRDVLEHFGEREAIEADNTLGNLTLLDARTNRGYRNAPFPMKRKKVLALDKTGTFVPRCTTNVFLKYYNKRLDNMLSWTESCAESHREEMVTTLADFLAPEGHRAKEVSHA